MRKVCTTLALAILTPFAWVTAQDDQGPAEKATNTTKKAAQATGQTIKHGAQATGSAISRGTKATERTVGKTLERTGSKIREAGATTKHVVRHRTTHTTAKKSATSEGSPSPGVSQHQVRKKMLRLALLRHRAPKQIHLQRREPHQVRQRSRSGSFGNTETNTTGWCQLSDSPTLRHAGGCSTRSTSAVSIYSVNSRSCPSAIRRERASIIF